MPTITRTFIKTAMMYMLLGMLLSTLWLVQLAAPIHPLLSYLQPTALHLIVVGIAIWMFPPWSKSSRADLTDRPGLVMHS